MNDDHDDTNTLRLCAQLNQHNLSRSELAVKRKRTHHNITTDEESTKVDRIAFGSYEMCEDRIDSIEDIGRNSRKSHDIE